MKEFTPGLLVHRCSNAMRISKPIKVYRNTASLKRPCPNCGKFEASIVITQPNLDKAFRFKVSQAMQQHKEDLAGT